MAECDSQKSIILLSSQNEGLVISHDKANIEKDYAIKIFRWFKELERDIISDYKLLF